MKPRRRDRAGDERPEGDPAGNDRLGEGNANDGSAGENGVLTTAGEDQTGEVREGDNSRRFIQTSPPVYSRQEVPSRGSPAEGPQYGYPPGISIQGPPPSGLFKDFLHGPP